MHNLFQRKKENTMYHFPIAKEQRDIPLLRRGEPLSETKGRGGFLSEKKEERGKSQEPR